MENTWNGALIVDQGDTSETHQIQILTPGITIPPASRLYFLSFVYCTGIPLHIVCGPTCEVIGPRTWLYKTIADTLPCSNDESEGPYPGKLVVESEIGALVRVEQDGKKKHCGVEITEFLLYASRDCDSQLSNTPMPDDPAWCQFSRVRFFALPLSSRLLYDPNLYELPPTPPAEHQPPIIEAAVLQPLNFNRSRKKQRLNDLFQDAAKTKRKPVRQDSQDITRPVSSRPQSPLLPLDGEAENKSSHITRPTKSHSRTQSLTSFQDDRPQSRGFPLERARSSLSRVTSTNTLSKPDLTNGDTSALQEDGSTTTIEDKNKRALSSIVMAGMRMRGMSQKKRKDEDLSLGPDDLEYKLVYHNAFKAASFALRTKFNDELSSEVIREVVDVLLDLFCAGNEGFVTHEGFR